jgi:hypothetical protein
LPRTSAGWPVREPTEALANTANILVSELREKAPEALPRKVKVDLLFPARVGEDGTFTLVSRGSVEAIPQRENQRPTRFSKLKLEAGACLDSFILGEKDGAWGKATDRAIFEVLLAYCEQTQPSPAATRALADEICLAVLLRAGIVVTKVDLPLPEHLRAER